MDLKEKPQLLKGTALVLAITGQILTFVYYFFILNKGKQVFLTFIAIVLSASQFSFVFIIARKSSRLLSNSQSWFRILKLVGCVSFALYFGLVLFLSIYPAKQNVYASCSTFYWSVLNVCQNLDLGIFCCFAGLILRTITKFVPTTELSEKLHLKYKQKYQRQLRICLITTFTYISVNIIYTVVLYYMYPTSHSCTRLTSSYAFNQMVWVVQRTLTDSLWVLPFVWMFWVDKEKAKAKVEAKSLRETSNEVATKSHEISFIDDSSDDNDWHDQGGY